MRFPCEFLVTSEPYIKITPQLNGKRNVFTYSCKQLLLFLNVTKA